MGAARRTGYELRQLTGVGLDVWFFWGVVRCGLGFGIVVVL